MSVINLLEKLNSSHGPQNNEAVEIPVGKIVAVELGVDGDDPIIKKIEEFLLTNFSDRWFDGIFEQKKAKNNILNLLYELDLAQKHALLSVLLRLSAHWSMLSELPDAVESENIHLNINDPMSKTLIALRYLSQEARDTIKESVVKRSTFLKKVLKLLVLDNNLRPLDGGILSDQALFIVLSRDSDPSARFLTLLHFGNPQKDRILTALDGRKMDGETVQSLLQWLELIHRESDIRKSSLFDRIMQKLLQHYGFIRSLAEFLSTASKTGQKNYQALNIDESTVSVLYRELQRRPQDLDQNRLAQLRIVRENFALALLEAFNFNPKLLDAMFANDNLDVLETTSEREIMINCIAKIIVEKSMNGHDEKSETELRKLLDLNLGNDLIKVQKFVGIWLESIELLSRKHNLAPNQGIGEKRTETIKNLSIIVLQQYAQLYRTELSRISNADLKAKVQLQHMKQTEHWLTSITLIGQYSEHFALSPNQIDEILQFIQTDISFFDQASIGFLLQSSEFRDTEFARKNVYKPLIDGSNLGAASSDTISPLEKMSETNRDLFNSAKLSPADMAQLFQKQPLLSPALYRVTTDTVWLERRAAVSGKKELAVIKELFKEMVGLCETPQEIHAFETNWKQAFRDTFDLHISSGFKPLEFLGFNLAYQIVYEEPDFAKEFFGEGMFYDIKRNGLPSHEYQEWRTAEDESTYLFPFDKARGRLVELEELFAGTFKKLKEASRNQSR